MTSASVAAGAGVGAAGVGVGASAFGEAVVGAAGAAASPAPTGPVAEDDAADSRPGTDVEECSPAVMGRSCQARPPLLFSV